MSTPYAGDGLVRPLNAPPAHQVLPGVQPGVTGAVVLAQYVIIFGTGPGGAQPGMFIYQGSPGPGNPPVFSISDATSDPYKNAIAPGIWAGPFGSTQAGLEYNGTAGQLLFPVGGTSPTLVGGISGVAAGAGGSEVQVFSAQDSGAGNTDRVFMVFADHLAGVTSAEYFLVYQDAGAVNRVQAEGGATGLFLFSVASISAVLPGTGTDPANAAQSETWHTATLINNWAGSGSGVNGLRYRVAPWGDEIEIEADIINAVFVPPGNSTCFVLPAGWRPSANRNRPAGWNNPQVNNSATVPWVFVDTAGNVTVTGIEAANKQVFFHVWVPR